MRIEIKLFALFAAWVYQRIELKFKLYLSAFDTLDLNKLR